MSYRLSSQGLERIAELQDKYHFQTTFEIVEKEDCINFLTDIQKAGYLGLELDERDSKFVEDALYALQE